MTPANQKSHHGIQSEKPSRPTGIQVEKPLPPWEQPGCFRLDCLAHRGFLLLWTALGSFVLALPIGWWLGLPVVALAISLVVWRSACRDLDLMQKGLMDPSGKRQTLEARNLSRIVFWFCCLSAVPVLCWLVGWMRNSLR